MQKIFEHDSDLLQSRETSEAVKFTDILPATTTVSLTSLTKSLLAKSRSYGSNMSLHNGSVKKWEVKEAGHLMGKSRPGSMTSVVSNMSIAGSYRSQLGPVPIVMHKRIKTIDDVRIVVSDEQLKEFEELMNGAFRREVRG